MLKMITLMTLVVGLLAPHVTLAQPAATLTGIYDVYRLDNPNVRITGMIIRQTAQNLTIAGIGQPWSGRGTVTGQSGNYDWRFADGKTGRTDFRINPDGSLQGRVLGSGVDFMFLARRSSVAAQVPVLPMPVPMPRRSGGDSCVSQINQCQPCQNGRYSMGRGSLCRYDSLSDCRASIMEFCKSNPTSGQALDVRGGKLTNHQAYELTMSCPNIPHGSIPYSGSPPAPGSKKMQQCQAFEKTYFACNMLFRGFDKRVIEQRRKCLTETYTGP